MSHARDWVAMQSPCGAYPCHAYLCRARLLKAPIHTGYIDRVLGIYPDASMVWMYRDPARVRVPLCGWACPDCGHY